MDPMTGAVLIVLGSLGFVVVAAVSLYGINENYDIKINFSMETGMPILDIDLEPKS